MSGGDLELRVAWERHLGTSPTSLQHLASVTARYREPHRHYHTVRHLTWVVRHTEALTAEHELADVGATIAAGFFHDVVYDAHRSDNEEVSARVAAHALDDLGWETTRVGHVNAMIIGTASHDTVRSDGTDIDVDTAVLYAADLAVLAADPAGYGDYVRNVRREYAHVADDEWVTGRSAVLRSFLERPSIFAPLLDLTVWEARARANLTSELVSLAG